LGDIDICDHTVDVHYDICFFEGKLIYRWVSARNKEVGGEGLVISFFAIDRACKKKDNDT
jgi:hypothetical protein